MHQHRDMEIITIVQTGEVTHEDSMGNLKTIHAGEVQVMSAGTGIFHSEYNHGDTVPLHLFQIWIMPHTSGILPRYDQMGYSVPPNGFVELVTGTQPGTLPKVSQNERPLQIAQNAKISLGTFDACAHFSLEIPEGSGVYLLVIDGKFQMENGLLQERDAIEVSDVSQVSGDCVSDGTVLVIQVPMIS